MPNAKVGELYVELQARLDKLDAGLAAALAKIKAAQNKIAKDGEKVNPFGGILGKAAKAVAVMGTVELGVKAVNAVSEAINGNWEEAGRLVKSLPAGIGQVATALEGVLGKVTGITAEMRRLAEETDKANKRSALIAGERSRVQQAEEISDSIEHQGRLIAAQTSLEKQLLAIEADRQARNEKILQLKSQTAGAGNTISRIGELTTQSDALAQQQIADAQRAEEDRRNSELAAMEETARQREALIREQAERERAMRVESMRSEAREIRQLQAELEVAQLEALGDAVGARQREIEARFKERLLDADSPVARQLLEQIKAGELARAGAADKAGDVAEKAKATAGQFAEGPIAFSGSVGRPTPVELSRDDKALLAEIGRRVGLAGAMV